MTSSPRYLYEVLGCCMQGTVTGLPSHIHWRDCLFLLDWDIIRDIPRRDFWVRGTITWRANNVPNQGWAIHGPFGELLCSTARRIFFSFLSFNIQHSTSSWAFACLFLPENVCSPSIPDSSLTHLCRPISQVSSPRKMPQNTPSRSQPRRSSPDTNLVRYLDEDENWSDFVERSLCPPIEDPTLLHMARNSVRGTANNNDGLEFVGDRVTNLACDLMVDKDKTPDLQYRVCQQLFLLQLHLILSPVGGG